MSQELQLLIVCFCFLTLEEGVAEGLFRSLIPDTSRKPGLSSPPTAVEMQIRPPQMRLLSHSLIYLLTPRQQRPFFLMFLLRSGSWKKRALQSGSSLL